MNVLEGVQKYKKKSKQTDETYNRCNKTTTTTKKKAVGEKFTSIF